MQSLKQLGVLLIFLVMLSGFILRETSLNPLRQSKEMQYSLNGEIQDTLIIVISDLDKLLKELDRVTSKKLDTTVGTMEMEYKDYVIGLARVLSMQKTILPSSKVQTPLIDGDAIRIDTAFIDFSLLAEPYHIVGFVTARIIDAKTEESLNFKLNNYNESELPEKLHLGRFVDYLNNYPN